MKAIQHNKSMKVSWCWAHILAKQKTWESWFPNLLREKRLFISMKWPLYSRVQIYRGTGRRRQGRKTIPLNWVRNEQVLCQMVGKNIISPTLTFIRNYYYFRSLQQSLNLYIAERRLLSSSLRGINVNKSLIYPFLNKIKIRLEKQKY